MVKTKNEYSWERQHVNCYGEITNIERSNVFTDQPIYDRISGISYQLEYLKKENADSIGNGNGCEPWELRDVYRTFSPGLFIREILLRLFDPEVEEIFPYIETDVSDTCIQVPRDIRHVVRQMIQADTEVRLNEIEKQLEIMQNEIDLYKSFLKKYNAEELFNRYRIEEND